MKILLVLPASDDLRALPDRPARPRRMLRFSVLPLTAVAALTPPGHEVAICDENVEPLDLARDADVVGLSFMTALAPRAYEIAAAFRRRGAVVVAGGYHPTFLPDEAARHVDAVVVGDAEGAWERVIADVEAGRLSPRTSPGRIYRHDGPVPLAAIPVPRRDLTRARAGAYATLNAVQAGRGCVHGCRYCSVTAFHRGTYRTRPVDEVLAEIRALRGDFMFVDDNIVADRDYARRLLAGLAGLGRRWVSQGALTVADDPELLDLLARAGCVGLFVGLETDDPRNLAIVGKGFSDPRGYGERVARLRSRGIGVIAGVIVGMDHDGPDVFARTLRFLDDARVDAIQLNIMTPLPGTPLFDDFDRAGRLVDRDWRHYDFRHVVIRPAGMTAPELQQGADWLLARFYRADRIAARFLRALATLGPRGALLGLALNLTYRRDVARLGLRRSGRNPAAAGHRPETPGVAPLDRRHAPGAVGVRSRAPLTVPCRPRGPAAPPPG